MKKIYFLSVVLCLFEVTLFAQTPRNMCLMVDGPVNTNRNSVNRSGPVTEVADTCGNYYVNVFFHFIRDNNGATGQAVGNVTQYMNILNGAFNPHNVFFIYKGYDEIRNSTWASTNFNFGGSTANFNSYNTTNSRSDAINVYLFRQDNNFPSGIATRISNRCAVGGGDGYAANWTLSGVLAHEVGHCLSLLHTHHGTDSNDPGPSSCPEDPSGSNGSTCGDFIADTPADPNIGQLNFGNCSSYSRIENGITYNPNPQNYMSYATPNCLSLFTTGQANQFHNALDNEPDLQPIQQLSASINGSGAVCSSNVYTIQGAAPGATLTWSVSSNIQILSGQGTTSVTLQAVGSGTGTVSASVSICGTTYTASTIAVSVGMPTISGFKVNGQPFTNGTICQNSQQYIEALPFEYDTYTWSISSGNPSHASLSSSGNTAIFQAYYAECFGVSVTAQNACGTVQSGLSFCAQDCFARYTVYPNPVKDQVFVEFDQVDNAEALPDEIDLIGENSTNPIRAVNVQDEYQNKRLANGKSIVLNVKDLARGTYYLHIKNNRKQDNPTDRIRIILE